MQVESSGTVTPTVGTPSTLASPATAHTRVLLVDVAALASGDSVTLTLAGPVLSGGASQTILTTTFTGAQGEPHTQSPPVLMPQGGTVKLEQTTGTARAFPWAVCTLD